MLYTNQLETLILKKVQAVTCGGYAVTHLYNPLGGTYYRSYGCVLLSRGIRRRRPEDVQLLATGVYNY